MRRRARDQNPPSSEWAEQEAEIERDRRSERKLVWQSLLALLIVAALVVIGRLLAP